MIIATTHHQPAQPTTLAHYLVAAAAVVGRDHDRVLGALRRLDRCPLGAAALAGSSHPLDRAFTAAALGFSEPVANTYDAVAAGDWQLDLAALGQTLGVGLSRLVHDLVAAASDGWLRLDDDLVQGSSIMPQKRNPVTLEHARTRFGRAAGAAQMLAFAGHNVPFGDVNDIGPDAQEAVHTLLGALDGGLELLVACLRGATVDTDRLAARAAATDTTATELADELVRTGGRTFPEAHRIAAALVRRMADRGRPLATATPDDLVGCAGPRLPAEVLADALSPAAFVARRNGLGGPAPTAVRSQIERARAELAEYHRVGRHLDRSDRRGAPAVAGARKGHTGMKHFVRTILVAAVALIGVAQAQVTITYWQYDFATRIDAMNQLIEQFNAENPDVIVVQETFPYDAYQQRVAAALAAGQGPDVAQLFYGWVGAWQRAGYVEPLPQAVLPGRRIQEYFIPMIESVNIDGDYYGLPTAVRALALFYNKDHFAEVGLDPEAPPTTWDAFVDAAKALTIQRGPRFERIGYGIAPTGQDHHLVRTVMMNQLGTPPYSADNTEVLYGNDIGAQALDFYTSWQPRARDRRRRVHPRQLAATARASTRKPTSR